AGLVGVVLDPAHVGVVPVLLLLGNPGFLGGALGVAALGVLAGLLLGELLLLLRFLGDLLLVGLLGLQAGLRLLLAREVEEHEHCQHYAGPEHVHPFFHEMGLFSRWVTWITTSWPPPPRPRPPWPPRHRPRRSS